MNNTWTILHANGTPALNFTSLLKLDLTSGGKALSNPVEAGAFVNYSKTREPIRLKVELGFQGDSADLERALDKLEELKTGAVLLNLVSPGAVYHDLTLEAYGYGRGKDSGGGILTVSLDLVEVRQTIDFSSKGPLGRPANPSSLAPVNMGLARVVDIKRDDPKWAVLFKKPYSF